MRTKHEGQKVQHSNFEMLGLHAEASLSATPLPPPAIKAVSPLHWQLHLAILEEQQLKTQECNLTQPDITPAPFMPRAAMSAACEACEWPYASTSGTI